MTKTQAQQTVKNLQVEASSLTPSTVVDLFEIDLFTPAQERGITLNENERYFRFHNQVKLLTTSIFWRGKEYIMAPVDANGFQKTSEGALPTPKLSITVNETGIPLLALLKEKIRLLGDLVGCKLIRYRTFAAFLTSTNFNVHNEPSNLQTDEYAEFPPEIWYFNRKIRENRLIIEYELNSILDVAGIRLPRRQMIAQRCVHTYRGEGCLYEYGDPDKNRINEEVHGEFAVLPKSAPPIATEDDKIITEVLGIISLTDTGAYESGKTYNIGEYVYITNQGVKYYYVAKRNGVSSIPPNPIDWIADQCSKCIKGCKFRWGSDGAVDVTGTQLRKGELPFGGFFALERIRG